MKARANSVEVTRNSCANEGGESFWYDLRIYDKGARQMIGVSVNSVFVNDVSISTQEFFTIDSKDMEIKIENKIAKITS